MSDFIWEKLKTFIVDEAGVHEDEVTREASIEEDLGITGDDAVDFMIAYGKTFVVDVTQFMAADYFNGEGYEILPFLKMFNGITQQPNKIVTVAHLEKGILAGRLDENVING